MRKATIAEVLTERGACNEAVAWARGYTSRAAAWRECKRGDWMLWLLGRLAGNDPASPERRKLTLAACACARLALKRVPDGAERPLKAIETAERWGRGEDGVTLDGVREASRAAAAYAAAYAYAAAACAAAYACADAAAAAAAAAAYAAYAADAAAARAKVLAKCADIVREFYPKPPVVR